MYAWICVCVCVLLCGVYYFIILFSHITLHLQGYTATTTFLDAAHDFTHILFISHFIPITHHPY